MEITCGFWNGPTDKGDAYIRFDASGNPWTRVTFNLAGWIRDTGYVSGFSATATTGGGMGTATFRPGSLQIEGSWANWNFGSSGSCSNSNWPLGSI